MPIEKQLEAYGDEEIVEPVVIDFPGDEPEEEEPVVEHEDNLAESISESELSIISSMVVAFFLPSVFWAEAGDSLAVVLAALTFFADCLAGDSCSVTVVSPPPSCPVVTSSANILHSLQLLNSNL